MTIEAALALPVFIFFSLALMKPMKWLDTQRKIQTVTECFSEELSQYYYMVDSAAAEDNSHSGAGNGETEDSGEEFDTELLSNVAAGLWLQGKAGALANNLTVTNAEVTDEQGNILFELSYNEKIPFFETVIDGVSMQVSSKRRAWIGLNGKLKSTEESEENESGENNEMVYVGASMGRYHIYRDCHYISNEYETVTVAEAELMKNSYGTRLTACSRCAGEGKAGTVAYITKEGEHYHFDQDCTAMISYVRSVPLEEVEYLGLCSYCARRKGDDE